jgi:hypothetical protein
MREWYSSRRWIALFYGVVMGVALAACGGGGGGGGSSPGGAGGAGGGGGGAGGAGGGAGGAGGGTARPLNVNLKQGDFMEFFWETEDTKFRQDKGGTSKVDVGRFKITLGASVLIQGQAAFPLTITAITGNPGPFAPRWTHIAQGADGSLLGSIGGAGLTKIYDASTSTWVGGGMFVDFAANAMTVSTGNFDGAYNDVPNSIVASRSSDQPLCVQLLGQQICNDKQTEFSEREFYKEGIGAIGFVHHEYYLDNGGGFTTSTTIDKHVELIETSLRPTDGSVFARPPWEEMAPLATPRKQHAAVALDGQIWVLGGLDQNNTALASVEMYDPKTNQWTPERAMPQALGELTAVAIGGMIYVPTGSDQVLRYYPKTGSWSSSRPTNSPAAVAVWDAAYYNDRTFGLGEILIGASIAGSPNFNVDVVGYQPSKNQWVYAPHLQQRSQLLRFTVETVADSMFVLGGFGPLPLDLFNRSGALDDVMRFDIAADTWGADMKLNHARDNHASTALNGKIYVFGGNPITCEPVGTCTVGAPLRTAEVLDPASGKSADLPPMFHPRKNFDVVTVDGLIYAIGGSNGTDTLGSMERFTPP